MTKNKPFAAVPAAAYLARPGYHLLCAPRAFTLDIKHKSRVFVRTTKRENAETLGRRLGKNRSAGRLAHTRASADLDLVADEVVLIVKAMAGLNRFRFGRQPELLAAWTNVSHVIATPRSTSNIRPAE